jgi:hypothetical protein
VFGLTPSEALLVCDTIGGRHLPRYVVGSRPLEYMETDVEGPMTVFQLDRRWGVDAATVLEKVRALDLTQRRALIVAIDKFWELSHLPREEALRQAGLI